MKTILHLAILCLVSVIVAFFLHEFGGWATALALVFASGTYSLGVLHGAYMPLLAAEPSAWDRRDGHE